MRNTKQAVLVLTLAFLIALSSQGIVLGAEYIVPVTISGLANGRPVWN